MSYKTIKERFIKESGYEVPLEAIDKLLDFHKKLKSLNRLDDDDKDIDSIACEKIFGELESYLYSKYDEDDALTNQEIKSKMYVLGENSEYIVYGVNKYCEINLFRGRTNWCICSGTKEEAKEHFEDYSDGYKNVFYFFVRKQITNPDDVWNYIALQRCADENDVYWDMKDKRHGLSDIPVKLPEFDKPPLEKFPIEERLENAGFKKNSNGEYDFDRDVSLSRFKDLINDGKLIIKFGKVNGYFCCSELLTSLEGCPREVGGSFYCNGCNITSLEGAPGKVGGNFNCSDCQNLTSLKGCPREVGGYFSCSFCKNLKSLECAPRKINGYFMCSSCNSLTSLEGAPEKIGEDFDCGYCKNLTSLNGSPMEVGKDFLCNNCNKLTILEGAPEKVDRDFRCSLCKNLKNLEGAPKKVGGDFNCSYCGSLKNLKGAPREVGGSFDCSNCENLKNLEGSPRIIGRVFYCDHCKNLTSLKGAPENVDGNFDCSFCDKLKSLDGAPGKISRTFRCDHCGIDFTEDYIKERCNVSGKIIV